MTRRSYNIVVRPVIEYDSLVVQNPAKNGSKNPINGIRTDSEAAFFGVLFAMKDTLTSSMEVVLYLPSGYFN